MTKFLKHDDGIAALHRHLCCCAPAGHIGKTGDVSAILATGLIARHVDTMCGEEADAPAAQFSIGTSRLAVASDRWVHDPDKPTYRIRSRCENVTHEFVCYRHRPSHHREICFERETEKQRIFGVPVSRLRGYVNAAGLDWFGIISIARRYKATRDAVECAT